MTFNLAKNKVSKEAQGMDIYDQSAIDAYLQMIMGQLDAAGVLNTEDSLARLTDLESLSNYGIENLTQLKELIDQQKNAKEEQAAMQSQFVAPPAVPGSPVTLTPPPARAASVKPFNHKKAQIPPAPVEQQKMFGSHQELKDWLLQYASSPSPFRETWQVIQNENPSDAESTQSALKNFYDGIELKSPEKILDEANELFNYIYGKEEDTMTLNVPFGEPSGMPLAASDEVSEILRKIANKTVDKLPKGKPFNLKKTAQHKTQENAIMWGPGQTRIDPFLRQPVSDWHIVERNKGFGLVVDDVWNIDYETIWRENVMDKYSRPYRDKDGKWVGGYIQKRFEVDKNIPEASNMQLKPGQKRKPILPEYGNTESRLQAARAAGEIEGAKDTSKPFNWKEAQAKKKS